MGLKQFVNTISIINKNPYANNFSGIGKHIVWQIRKKLNLFPCIITTDFFDIKISSKEIANGCGGLLNSMGLYDPNNMHLIRLLSEEGLIKCMFDIGANIGVYSLVATEKVKVYAFEPHPYTFILLNENVDLNVGRSISTVNLALDDSSGEISFSNVPGSPVNRILREKEINEKQIMVNAITGDDFCCERQVKPDLVKIDTEGNEMRVLTGLKNTLESVKIIIVESDSAQELNENLNNRFMGPLKYCHRSRLFSSEIDHYEDWVFINRQYINELSELFSIKS